MGNKYTYTLLAVLAIAVNTAMAQVTDVAEKVNAALTAVGPMPVTTIIQVPRPVRVCNDAVGMPATGGGGQGSQADKPDCKNATVYDPVATTDNRVLQASNIRIITTDQIVFGAPTRTELPDQVSVDDSFVQDCSGAPPFTQQFTIQRAFQRSSSVSLLQSVTHTMGAQANASYKVGKDVQFTVGLQLSYSVASTNAVTTIDSTQETVTRSRAVSATLQPGTATVLEIRVWPIQFVIPFTTTVTVDADLTPNDKNLRLLSQVLPDASARTFPISGTLTVNDASEASSVQYTVPYDPNQCVGTAKKSRIVTDHFRPASNTTLTVKLGSK